MVFPSARQILLLILIFLFKPNVGLGVQTPDHGGPSPPLLHGVGTRHVGMQEAGRCHCASHAKVSADSNRHGSAVTEREFR